MTVHRVASVDDLAPEERVVVQLDGREIAVFNVDGDYYAYVNWCLHQAGPVCEGALTGTQRASFDRESLAVDLSWCKDGEVLNCPWHGWEYDVRTGDCLSRRGLSLPSVPVHVEDGDVFVTL